VLAPYVTRTEFPTDVRPVRLLRYVLPDADREDGQHSDDTPEDAGGEA
jgi:hypothetical protein